MKKVFCLIIAASMLLGSVNAFAENTADKAAVNEAVSVCSKNEQRRERRLSARERIEKECAEREMTSEEMDDEQKEKEAAAEFSLMSESEADADTGLGGAYDDIIWSLDNGVLTISGSGVVKNDWSDYGADYSTHIREVVIGEGITEIYAYSFEGCTNLEKVTLPDTLEIINVSTFADCYSLADINIPASVRSIGEDAFEYCYNLSKINVDKRNPYYESIDGVLFEKGEDYKTLICYPDNKKSRYYNVPEGTTSLLDRVFTDNIYLEKVVIPEGVTEIHSSFEFCTNLKELVIPASVEYINNYAFDGCYKLEKITITEDNEAYKSVDGVLYKIVENDGVKSEALIKCPAEIAVDTFEIPDTVTSIANSAFEACWNIKNIEIPESVASIGSSAFADTAVTNIQIPSGVTKISAETFAYCSELKEVILPDGIEEIGESAFYDCEKLESINLPDSIVSIGQYAFKGSALVGVIIPDGVDEIDAYLFLDCKNLSSVTIPAAVTYICPFAFDGCTSLEKITVAEGNTVYESVDGVLFGDIESIDADGNIITDISNGTLVKYPAAKEGTSYIIPVGTSIVGNYAFEGSQNLTEVIIPEGVQRIGYNAFESSSKLEKVIIPDGVTEIDSYAFAWCGNITEISVPDSVTEIRDGVFYYCRGLEKVKLPSNIDAISARMFYGCESLLEINIPDNVEIIGDYAFRGCESLAQIKLPAKLEEIGDYVFKNCTALTELEIPNAVKAIGWCAFENCTALGKVTLSEKLEALELGVFSECTGIEKIKIPASVNNIYGSAFEYCTSLTDITVDEANENYISVDGIVYSKDMTALCLYPEGKADKSYTVSSSVEYIYEGIECCTSLERILVEEGNENFKSVDGVLYDYDVTSIVVYPAGKTDEEYTYPETITEVIDNAFDYNFYIAKINIPKTVNYIDSYAFVDCYSLEEMAVDEANPYYKSVDGVLFTKDGAMLVGYPNAKQGNEYIVPDGVKGIGYEAFGWGNENLESIILSDTVTYIEESGVYGCYSLKSITVPESVVYIASLSENEDVVIKGYAGSYAEYYADYEWYNFEALKKELVEITASKVVADGETVVTVTPEKAVDAKVYVVQYDESGYILSLDEAFADESGNYITPIEENENAKITKVIVLDADYGVIPISKWKEI